MSSTGYNTAHFDQSKMQEIAQKSRSNIVIAENVPAWQQHIGRIVGPLAPESQIHYAVNALLLIDALRGQTPDAIRLVLTDLHMTEDGTGNGDDLIAGLMARPEPMPPMALVSGTLTDPIRHDLAARTPGLGVLEKDAFSPAVDDFAPIRGPLIAKLMALLDPNSPVIPKDLEIVSSIRTMKSRLASVAQSRILADETKGRLSEIYAEYRDFLDAIPLAEIIVAPDLYDDTGIKLHEFKNQLSHLIDDLTASQECPPVLIAKLASLQVYINRLAGSRIENIKETDVVATTENICRNFGRFQGLRERMKFSSLVSELKIKTDQTKFQQMLVEMIQNALTHSTGTVEVKVDPERMEIVVNNDSSGGEDLCIHGGDVQQGSLDTTNTAGSGKGLKFLMDTAKSQGLNFGFFRYSDETKATASLGWDEIHEGRDSRITVAQDSTGEVVSENPPEMPNVVFICHNGTPEETFAQVLRQAVPDYRYIIADVSEYEMEGFAKTRAELFDKAALVVIHMDAFGHEKRLTPLYRDCPHLTFLPVSMMPRSLNIRPTLESLNRLKGMSNIDPETENSMGIGATNIMLESDIAEFLEEQARSEGKNLDHDLVNRVCSELYQKNPTPEAWNVYLQVAQKLALKRKSGGKLSG